MQSYDLTIIGAGVLGTFHAYHALNRGLTVCLAEKDAQPVAASVRNFGQAVPSGLSSAWHGWGRRGVEIYLSIQQQFDIAVRQNGSVYVASDETEQQLLHELHRRMTDKDYPCELLTPQQCLARWPALSPAYVREGLYFPLDASLEPDLMIHRLLAWLQARFADRFRYLPATPVVGCDRAANAVTLTGSGSGGRRWQSHRALICSGSEFRLLFPEHFAASGLVAVKLQMMQTTPVSGVTLAGNVLTGLTVRRYESFKECPSYSKIVTPPHLAELSRWGIHILFKQAVDGSVIIGDSHEYAPCTQAEQLGFAVHQNIQRLILKEAARIVTFDVFSLQTAWAAFYSQHPDKDIVLIDVDDRIRICTGIGGKGMTTSAGFAEHHINQLAEA
jgi:FAD dependent oxidoreductase TIGR03364